MNSRFSFTDKVLACVLSLMTVLLSLPVSVFANDLISDLDGESMSSENQYVRSVFEDTSLRTLNTRTVRLQDGSFYSQFK